jgi:uncharacterized protein DUF2637
MSDYPAVAESQSSEPSPRLRAAALTAVIAGVVLVAGAAFVLSYQGIHQIALNAGVSPELARLYPVILDAMLVMSCAAALALRTAGLWTRLYVWTCLILLLAAVAAGNALYAMNISLPAQPTRAVVAVLPWALLLMSLGMLLAMLRHWRRIRVASAEAGQARPASPADGVAAGATLGAVSWAGSPGSGPAKPGTPRSGAGELMEPRTGQPPERAAAVAAGTAGTRAAIASGEAAEGKRPGPATTPESTGAADRDDTAARPPATPADEDMDAGPAVSYEAEPTAPAGTAGAVRVNGPAGAAQAGGAARATQPVSGAQPGAATQTTTGAQPGTSTQPVSSAQPGTGTQPAAPAGGTGPGPAATPAARPDTPAPGMAGAAAPAGTARANGPAAPTPASGSLPAATPASGPVRAAAPATGPVPAPAPPAEAGAQPGTNVPFLDRILSGPTNPNAPEAGGG